MVFLLCCLQCISQLVLQLVDQWHNQPATAASMSQCSQSLNTLVAQSGDPMPSSQASDQHFTNMLFPWVALLSIVVSLVFLQQLFLLGGTFLRGGTGSTASCTNQKHFNVFWFVQGAVLSVPPRFSNRVIIAPGPSASSYGENAIIAFVYLYVFVIAPEIFFFEFAHVCVLQLQVQHHILFAMLKLKLLNLHALGVCVDIINVVDIGDV